MAGTVRYVAKQAFWLAGQTQQAVGHSEILFHMRSADVVDLAHLSSFENRENSTTIVLYVQPVALLLAVAVDGKRLVIERVRDHQRKEFLGKLIRPIIVRGARDQGGKIVGAHVGANQKVRGSLGSGIGAARLERKI